MAQGAEKHRIRVTASFMGNFDRSRLLAVVIQSGRYGFAAFEMPNRLIDCGMRRFDSPAKARRQLARLLRLFRPSLVVIHRRRYRDLRSGRVAKVTMQMARRQATKMKIRTTVMSGRSLRNYWQDQGGHNKYRVASLVAEQFPAFSSKLPSSERKCYEREPWSMIRFDAIALGVAHLARRKESLGEALSPDLSVTQPDYGPLLHERSDERAS